MLYRSMNKTGRGRGSDFKTEPLFPVLPTHNDIPIGTTSFATITKVRFTKSGPLTPSNTFTYSILLLSLGFDLPILRHRGSKFAGGSHC
jgi:hypothetical protein